MPVEGLVKTEDEYMLDILRMDLPGDHKVEKVWVEMTRDIDYLFIAKARMTSGSGHGKRTRDYSTGGNTIKEALLELVAEIVVKYPVEEGERVDIDIPVADIINTRTFKLYFRAE